MKPRLFSGWDLLAAAGGCALWAFYQKVLPRLPDPVPTHFDAAGRANGWTPKDHLHWIVFGLPLLVWLLLLGVGAASAAAEKDPARAEVQAFRPLRGTLVLGFCLLMGATLLIPLHGLRALGAGVGLLFACLAAGVAFLGRDTFRYLKDAPDAGNYRWGVFYNNPEDPRLWVPKRIGLGWTLNYARPAAWWLTALFLLPVAAVLGAVLLTLPR